MPIQPYGAIARANANDLDISHPWVMSIYPPRLDSNNNSINNSPIDKDSEFLTIENGNHAVECLQMYIDALVESGRAGDTRLGVHFFREWVQAVTGEEVCSSTDEGQQQHRQKKRQKVNTSSSRILCHLPLGSLSLHNLASASINTFRSMEYANVGSCLGTLDLTGVHGLTDSILSKVICSGSFPRLRRLSVKNCRKLTGKSIKSLGNLRELKALDVGGCFNVHPNDVIEMVQQHPGTKRGTFTEIYASGLSWTDVALEELLFATSKHLRGLGVGFSPYLSGPCLILTLTNAARTLDRLSISFCSGVDDAVLSALGKNLPKLAVLDIRGCSKVYSLTGMMDGRNAASAAIGAEGIAEHLFVLARYSGISNNSLEETSRLYRNEQGDPVFTCIVDSEGTGGGIRR
jgi:solute carrier family 6 GABA transporter-like protein 1